MSADPSPPLVPPDPHHLLDLVVAAIEAIETSGDAGYHAFLDRHPDARQRIESRVMELRGVGLVGSASAAGSSGVPIAGERLGPYRIVRRIGEGGMGVVFLAEDERLHRLVALKTIPSHFGMSETARKRLQREASAVAKLAHPSIVPVYEAGEQAGVPWFAMEYAAGRTLAEVIGGLVQSGIPAGEFTAADLGKQIGSDASLTRGSRFVDYCCRIVIDVAAGLTHAHDHGVLHRDVKPSNIMIDPTGRARLFDFGLARVEDEAALTRSRNFAGTPYYVSPEQIRAKPEGVDERTDVWSLGVTLFELLTLRLPFEGESTELVLKRICESEPPLPRRFNSSISRDLQTVVLTALEKNRARRYRNCAAFAADLARVLESRPVTARPVSTLTRVIRLAARKKAAAFAILLATVLLIGTPIGLLAANLRIRAEKARAERAFEFFTRVIFEADVDELGPRTPIVEVIDKASAKVLAELGDEPEIEAMLLTKIGAFFLDLSDLARAERDLTKALSIDLKVRGEDDLETATTLNFLSSVMRTTGRTKEAESYLRRALVVRERRAGPLDRSTVETKGNLISLLTETSQLSEALGFLDDLTANYEASPSSDVAVIGDLYARRGRLEYKAHDPARSEAAFLRSLELYDRSIGPRERRYAASLNGLARIRLEAGRTSEAIELFQQSLATYASILGDENWVTAAVVGYIGDAMLKANEPARAFHYYQAAMTVIRKTAGEIGEEYEKLVFSSADAAIALRRLDAAESILDHEEEVIATAKARRIDLEFRLLMRRAMIAHYRGEPVGATTLLCEIVALAHESDGAADPARDPRLDTVSRFLHSHDCDDLAHELDGMRGK